MRASRILLALVLCLIPALTLGWAAPAAAQTGVFLEDAFPNLTFDQPVDLEYAPDGSEWFFVVEQPGLIRVFERDADVTSAPTFLDIEDRVSSGGERGLLGLAFHPDYETNGYLYVNYTASEDGLRTRISRFTSDLATGGPPAADPASESILMEYTQPFGNHNGGDVAFGPDGTLYIASGDGGSANDPGDRGQDEGTLLGKILRIDVGDGGTAPDCGLVGNYTVPDNAFADGAGGACDEIFAIGLRNPWRFSFDRAAGALWAGDVGQNEFEEVDIIANGDNMGWDVKEGFSCFDPDPDEPACSDPVLVEPVVVYDHSGGNCSITGGFVYRGERVEDLAGRYVYADYCSGRIWSLDAEDPDEPDDELVLDTDFLIVGFGEDPAGELYVLSSDGKVRRFADTTSGTEPPAPGAPALLATDGPNPFRARTAFRIGADAGVPVRLAAYDVLGREVAVLLDGPAPGVSASVPFEGAVLAAGVYVVRLTLDGEPAGEVRVVRVR